MCVQCVMPPSLFLFVFLTRSSDLARSLKQTRHKLLQNGANAGRGSRAPR